MTSHDHHTHGHEVTIDQSYRIGIVLNLVYVAAEVWGGFKYSSLALLSDAGHNLIDVLGLIISLLAFRFMHIKGNNRYTYGYRKASILASLLNSLLLLMTVAFIVIEAFER